MGIKRPLAWESQVTILRPNEKLTQLRPDWHVRRSRDGDRKVFVCYDKHGRQILLSQKVTLLAEHLSKIAKDKGESISTTSLYNIVTNDGKGLNCGFSKHRYKVECHSLEDAVEVFESARKSFDTATVLGSKSCLQTQLCV